MSPTDFKDIAQGAAVLGAAAYFLVRMIGGFFTVNLSLRVECGRAFKDEHTDWVAVRVHLTKGDRRTLTLHDVTVWRSGREPETVSALRRMTTTSAGGRPRAVGPTDTTLDHAPADRGHPLNITPGEEIEFGAMLEAPRSGAVVVEAAVLGRAWVSPFRSQWRASCASPPTYPRRELVVPPAGA